jgi:Ras-related protein Rab-8A
VNKVLVGNKADMESKRAVSKDAGQNLASEYGIPFFEASAKRDANVEDAFFAIARQVLKRLRSDGSASKSSQQTISIAKGAPHPTRNKSSCCSNA